MSLPREIYGKGVEQQKEMESYPSIIGNILETFSEGIYTIFDIEDEMEQIT